MKKISIVVPMFNEEEMAPLFLETVSKIINEIKNYHFEIVAVNDGSKDNTLSILLDSQKIYKNLVVVDLSRNWGHESAVLAGLQTATGDAVIPIDADLQDPPEIIPQMIEMWEEGYQVVNAKRGSRKKDSAFKKNTAGIYYKIIDKMSGKYKVPQNVANYRLIDRRVVNEVLALTESNRVLRIEIPFLGFKTGEVLFDREERAKGESKYNFKMMFNLALSSVLAITNDPLKWTMPLTISCFGLTGLSIILQIIFYICFKNGYNGINEFGHLAWLITNVIALFSCFIFLTLTIMSLYLSLAVTETRNRPFVVINKVYKE